VPCTYHPTPRRLVALLFVALVCIAIALSSAVEAGTRTGDATYRNPVFARDFPDPSVLKVGADYYAYATTTGWESYDHLFPILHSRDLAHGSYAGPATP